MDNTFSYLEENWIRDGAPDVSNELLNLSDHSDYAMESTSDLMDWSSLFGTDDGKCLFSDQRDNSANIQDFADFFLNENDNAGILSGSNIEKYPMKQQQLVQQSSFSSPIVSGLENQIPLQDLQNYQKVNQVPAQLFIQSQQLKQTQHIQIPQQVQIPQHIQIPQQIQQQISQQMQIPQQQPLHISFQAASPQFPQPQHIIFQQNQSQSIHAQQILLQPSQTQHAQVIISPQQQQQICMPSTNQKLQLLQQPQQQMFIVNGGTSGNSFESSQIVLAPIQQTQQNSIVFQQSQAPSTMPPQTIMLQIGNQLFQIQSPVVEKNAPLPSNDGKLQIKNGLSKMNAKQSMHSNSPSLVLDNKSGKDVVVSSESIKSNSRQITSSKNFVVPSSSTISLRPKVISPHSSSHDQSSLTFNLQTPVAKVRPLESKSGVSNKAIKIEQEDKKPLLATKVDLQDKGKSALEKMTPNPRLSFVNLKSVQKSEINFPSSSISSINSNPPMSLKLSDARSHQSPLHNLLSKSLTASNHLTPSSNVSKTAATKQTNFSKDFLRLSAAEKFKIHLMKDHKSALNPDTKTPFVQLRDCLKALAPYHVCQTRIDDDVTISEGEKLYEDMSHDLLDRKDALLSKFQHILLNKSTVHHDSVEDVMLGRLFLVQEMARLKEEKKLLETDPDSFIPRPVLSREEMAALYPEMNRVDESDDEDDEEEKEDPNEASDIEDTPDEAQSSKENVNESNNSNVVQPHDEHIIIKIKHHNGIFSASPASKRPRGEVDLLDGAPPIKVARIRLKRIDVTKTDLGSDRFRVVEDGSVSKLKEATNLLLRSCKSIHSKPNAVTAVVAPFHKWEYSRQEDSFSEKSGDHRHPRSHSPTDTCALVPPNLFIGPDESSCFDLLGDGMNNPNDDYDKFSVKRGDRIEFATDLIYSSDFHRPIPSMDGPLLSKNNDARMFASDSEEFVDSRLEIEMQSAIQSILSQRTE